MPLIRCNRQGITVAKRAKLRGLKFIGPKNAKGEASIIVNDRTVLVFRVEDIKTVLSDQPGYVVLPLPTRVAKGDTIKFNLPSDKHIGAVELV